VDCCAGAEEGRLRIRLLLLGCCVLFGSTDLRMPVIRRVPVAEAGFVQNIGVKNISISNNPAPHQPLRSSVNFIPTSSRIWFAIPIRKFERFTRCQHMGMPQRSFVIGFNRKVCQFFESHNFWGKETALNECRSLAPIFYRENKGTSDSASQLPSEKNPRTVYVFQRIGAGLSSSSIVLGNFYILPHPLFLSSYRNKLQNTHKRENARKYYEKAVVYFFYSLGPLIFFMIIVACLTFIGPNWLINVGCGLLGCGLLYLFLGTLLVGSGLLL